MIPKSELKGIMNYTPCFNPRFRKPRSQVSQLRPSALLRRLSGAASLAVASVVLTGCTTIPERQLQAYRKAFDEVRIQSANVLADYSASRQAKSNLASRAVSPTASTGQLDAQLNLQAYDARSVGAG